MRPSSLAKPRDERPRSPSPQGGAAPKRNRSPSPHPQVVSFASQLTEDAFFDAKNDVAMPPGTAADIGRLSSRTATEEAGRSKAVLTPRPRSESPAREVSRMVKSPSRERAVSPSAPQRAAGNAPGNKGKGAEGKGRKKKKGKKGKDKGKGDKGKGKASKPGPPLG